MTACLSNCKQMGLGVMQYTQDYDEMYPCNSWDTPPIGNIDSDIPRNPNMQTAMQWVFRIQPYVKNRGIFVCPSDPNPKNGWSCYTTFTGAGCGDAWGIPTP